MGFYSWHCAGCPGPSCPTWDTLASCSKDFGCIMMLPKAYVNSHPWPSDSSCCSIFLMCYTDLPVRHLVHCKDSLSTASSFFWKVHHARWSSKAYLIFEVESGMCQWKTQCKRSAVLQKALVTWWHAECFEREGRTSVESLQPEYRRHHWKQSPGKLKWKNDKWGWLPITTSDCKKERWIPPLLMPFWKMYFSQTIEEFKWNTSYYTQQMGRQITPELAIN